MANRNGAGSGKDWKQKYKELQKEHRRLRAELAKAEEQRDTYRKSLHLLTRKTFSFSARELRQMMENPVSTADILKDLEELKRKHG